MSDANGPSESILLDCERLRRARQCKYCVPTREVTETCATYGDGPNPVAKDCHNEVVPGYDFCVEHLGKSVSKSDVTINLLTRIIHKMETEA